MIVNLSLSFTIDEKKVLKITSPDGNQVSVRINPFFIQTHLPPLDPILGNLLPVTDWTEISIPETGTETTTAKTYFISISRLQSLLDFPELKLGNEVLKALNDKDTAKILSLLAQGTLHTKQRDICIQLAARDGLSEVIEPLVNNGPISQEAVSLSIRFACAYKHIGIAEWLLNTREISEKDAGLIILEATKNKDKAIIALILAKAKIPLEDRVGALKIACASEEIEIISLLDNEEITPEIWASNLYLAANNGLKNTTAFLFATGKISKEAREVAILTAITKNHGDILSLLDQGTLPIEARGKATRIAAKLGHTESILGLLQYGIISEKDREEALLTAIRNNKEDIVSLLDQGTLPIEARGAAIKMAAQLGHKEIVIGLLQKREISKKDREDALLTAINNKQADIVSVLDQGTLAEETRGKAIHLAAQLGHKEILKGLLQNEETSKKFREEALLSAIDAKQEDIVSFLDQGTLAEETRGKAIKLAAQLGHKEILKGLLQNEETSKKFREEALLSAIDGKQGDIVELLDQGTLTKETRGKAIKLAAQLGRKEILRVLLQNGEISENDRYAAISAAEEKGDLEIKSILLLPPSWTLSPGAA